MKVHQDKGKNFFEIFLKRIFYSEIMKRNFFVCGFLFCIGFFVIKPSLDPFLGFN